MSRETRAVLNALLAVIEQGPMTDTNGTVYQPIDRVTKAIKLELDAKE